MADPGYINPDTNVLTDPESWVALASTTLGSDTGAISFTSPDDGVLRTGPNSWTSWRSCIGEVPTAM